MAFLKCRREDEGRERILRAHDPLVTEFSRSRDRRYLLLSELPDAPGAPAGPDGPEGPEGPAGPEGPCGPGTGTTVVLGLLLGWTMVVWFSAGGFSTVHPPATARIVSPNAAAINLRITLFS